MDILSVLESHDGHLLKKLRIKKDSAVLAMEREGGSLFVLRIYEQEIPTYRMLAGHSCENLPAVYHCETRDGFFLVEEEYIDGICLQDMLDGGATLDENQAAAVVRMVCRALNVQPWEIIPFSSEDMTGRDKVLELVETVLGEEESQ